MSIFLSDLTSGLKAEAMWGYEYGDIDVDGAIGSADFSIMMSVWKQSADSGDAANANLNTDNIVNLEDFSILMANWEV